MAFFPQGRHQPPLDPAKSQFTRYLARTALNSRFFRNYWVAVDIDKADLDAFKKALTNHNLTTVGVFTTKGGRAQIVFAPRASTGADKQDEAKREILRKGVPNI